MVSIENTSNTELSDGMIHFVSPYIFVEYFFDPCNGTRNQNTFNINILLKTFFKSNYLMMLNLFQHCEGRLLTSFQKPNIEQFCNVGSDIVIAISQKTVFCPILFCDMQIQP